MLVLTRQISETIRINGSEIEVTVVSIKGNRVRLGIAAPRSVSVLRGELYEQNKQQETRDDAQRSA